MKLSLILGVGMFMIWPALWVLSGQVKTPQIPLQFIKQSGVVFGEYNTSRRTLTLRGGIGELWICVSTSAGKTCKSGEDVLNWITREGDEK